MTCEYLNCKFKKTEKNEFCGRHQKLGKKSKNPELYCTKKSCANLRVENRRRCQKCIAQSRNFEETRKKKRKQIPKTKCQLCEQEIEDYTTLCKHHYELEVLREDRRPERDRKKNFKEFKEFKEYDENIKDDTEYDENIKDDTEYDENIKDNTERLQFIYCYYCGKIPYAKNWNGKNNDNWDGIDGRYNNEWYTIKNSRSWCCKMCNTMKGTYVAKDFFEHCKKIVRHNNY